jgi:hypothetical protein
MNRRALRGDTTSSNASDCDGVPLFATLYSALHTVAPSTPGLRCDTILPALSDLPALLSLCVKLFSHCLRYLVSPDRSISPAR